MISGIFNTRGTKGGEGKAGREFQPRIARIARMYGSKRCDGAQISAQGAGVDLQAFTMGPQTYAQLIAAIEELRIADWRLRIWEAPGVDRDLVWRTVTAAVGPMDTAALFKTEFGVVSTVSDKGSALRFSGARERT